MNLGTMKTALRRYAGVDTTDPLVDWINAAMHELWMAHTWPFHEGLAVVQTAAGVSSITPPAFFDMPITLRIEGEPRMTYVPFMKFEEQYMDLLTQGKPTVFTVIGSEGIDLFPVPDGVYNIRVYYTREPTDLVLDADTPLLFPSRLHYHIVEGAAVKALEAESEEERAATARGVFEDAIDRAITYYGGKKTGDFATVRDVMEYGS